MPTIFTRIIEGEIPGRIVWRDHLCVAMVDIRPLNRGHVLVIPVAEVDRWTDLSADVAAHCTEVAHAVGNAQQDLDFAQADTDADPDDLDAVADILREALRAAGHQQVV